MKMTLLVLFAVAETAFGQQSLTARMLRQQQLEDAVNRGVQQIEDAVNRSVQKGNREIIEMIDELTFRVEVDANGKPLHIPSEFYDFSRGNPMRFTGDLREQFKNEIPAARKAMAYAAAWNRYYEALDERAAQTEAKEQAAAVQAQRDAKAQAEAAARPPVASRPAPVQAVQAETAADKVIKKAMQDSRVMARRLYPSIKAKDSPLAKKWTEIYESLPENDPLHDDPDASLKITIRAANKLGILPSE